MEPVFSWRDFTGEGGGLEAEDQAPGVPVVRQMLWQLFDAAPVGLLIADDATSRLLRVNAELCRMVGWTRAELEGQQTWAIVAPEDMERLKDYRVRRLRKDPTLPRSYEVLLQTRHGDRRVARLTDAVVPFDTVSLASLEDLTSERLLLDPMLHNLKVESLTSLAGGLAGEFNNLLAAISGFAQLAATRAEKPVEVRDALARIQAAAAKGTDLVSALLSFARRGSTLLESFDVARVLKNLSALLPGLAGKPILQESHATGDDFLVRGDSAQIEQALLNVLVNAADAVQGTGGKVGVEIRNVVVDSGSATDVGPGEYVSIRVTDNGEGIPVANLSRVFQPFFSTRSDGRHSGMGLAVALGIVRDHGGTMRIDSALGRGTTVTVLLPLQPSPSLLVPALVGPAQSALKDRTRILVVDDQEFVSELLRDVIETAGYAVFATTSGSDALDAIRSSRFVPHLAVVDMMMPGMDGRTLIRELRRLLPSLPVLAMSGFTQPTEGDAEIQSAVRGFVAKPFKNEHILSLVRSLAGSPEAMGRPLSGGSGP